MEEEVIKRLRLIVKSAIDSVDPLELLAKGSVSDVYTDEVSKILKSIEETFEYKFDNVRDKISHNTFSKTQVSKITKNIIFQAFRNHNLDNIPYNSFDHITDYILDRFFYFFGAEVENG